MKTIPREVPRLKKTRIVFSIAGVHGVGKTTIFNALKRQYLGNHDWYFLPERLQRNPPFPFGSKDLDVAFKSEVHFIQQMVQKNTSVLREEERRDHLITILDRTPLCVLVYSEALGLDGKTFSLLNDMYQSVAWREDYIVYLEARPRTIYERIRNRALLETERMAWNEDDYQYLKKILRLYDKYLRKPAIKPKVHRVPTEDRSPKAVERAVRAFILEKTGYRKNWGQEKTPDQKFLTAWFTGNEK